VKHSRITGRTAENEVLNNAFAANVGASLSLLGTAMLLLMRWLDLLLVSMKGREALPFLERFSTSLPESLRPAPWLEVSWFLIVPLALNAFVLCPIVFKRVMRYRRNVKEPLPLRLRASLAAATIFPMLALAYLALVVRHAHPIAR
jgi:hypothetical protein